MPATSKFKRYKYEGPLYCDGRKIKSKALFYTMARSFAEARNNILYQASKGFDTFRYDLGDDFLRPVEEVKETDVEFVIQRKTCPECGYDLTDGGYCPICDIGDSELLYN